MNRTIRFYFATIAISLFLCISCLLAEERILAPDFKLPDLKDELIALSSYKDKQPVLLFFWTTRCPLCIEAIKELNNKHTIFTQDGLKVLCIDIGESKERVARFTKRNYLVYNVLLDKDTSVAYTYEIIGVPTYVLIDKKGYVVFIDHYFPFQDYKDLLVVKIENE